MGKCRGAQSLSEEGELSEEAEPLQVGSNQAGQGLKERVPASTDSGAAGSPCPGPAGRPVDWSVAASEASGGDRASPAPSHPVTGGH